MAKQREVEQWITVNGVHVPVFKGESKADAAKNFKEKMGKRNAKQPMTKAGKEAVKKEYTNARNAEHSNKDPEKADAKRVRYEKAKDRYSQSKQQGTIKSVKMNKTIQTQESKLDPDRRKALDVTRNAEAKDKYGKDWYGLNDKQKAEIDRQLEKNHPDWYGRQASKDNDVIQEIQYKGEISRKDENGEWKVVGHYDNNKQAKTSTDNVTAAKTHQDLTDKLNKNGLKLDAADAHTMENSNSLNGEKVTMYDKDGNEYRGTYNKYSDGGREIVNIKKTADSPRKIARDNEDLKEKQIAENKAEAASRSTEASKAQGNSAVARKEDAIQHIMKTENVGREAAERVYNGMSQSEKDHFANEAYKQKVKEIKQYMEDHDTGLPAAKEHYDYMHPDEKAIEQMGKELHAKNSKEINDTINKMIDNGTSWNDAVRIAHKQFITDADKKILATPKGLRTEEEQVRVDGLRRNLKSKIDSMYSTYSQQYSADPNKWLQYGDKGKEAYHKYKEAVEEYEPNRQKRARYFKDRRKL